MPLKQFNFGLHNLDNSSAGEANYKLLLTNFTDNLRQLQPNAKLVYVLTTPFMPQELVGNNAVPDLNKIAIGIMSARNIPVLDLYSHITAYCGNLYVNCTICNTSPCSYHYTAEGYAYIAQFLAPAYAAILSSP